MGCDQPWGTGATHSHMISPYWESPFDFDQCWTLAMRIILSESAGTPMWFPLLRNHKKPFQQPIVVSNQLHHLNGLIVSLVFQTWFLCSTIPGYDCLIGQHVLGMGQLATNQHSHKKHWLSPSFVYHVSIFNGWGLHLRWRQASWWRFSSKAKQVLASQWPNPSMQLGDEWRRRVGNWFGGWLLLACLVGQSW